MAWPDDTSSGISRLILIDRNSPYPVIDAREAAVAAGWDWGLPAGLIDDVKYVVDALVSNALVHAKWPDGWPVVSVTVALCGRRAVVEVRDPDPTLPAWPGGAQVDIGALLDDPVIDADDPVLTHHQGLVDVAGRSETLTAFAEEVGKCVRAVLPIPAAAVACPLCGCDLATCTTGGCVHACCCPHVARAGQEADDRDLFDRPDDTPEAGAS